MVFMLRLFRESDIEYITHIIYIGSNCVHGCSTSYSVLYMFELAVHCWCVFEKLRAPEDLMSQFLAAIQHRTQFSKFTDRVPPAQYISTYVVDNCCTVGHDIRWHFVLGKT